MTDSVDVQDMEQYDSQPDCLNEALSRLTEYISNYPDGIILAGPPTLKGSLANFYKDYPADARTIKAFEHEEHKVGIHSFVQKYRDVINFNGKGAQKHVVLSKTSRRFGHQQVARSQHLIAESRPSTDYYTNYQITQLRGTIGNIYVLLNQLSAQVEKLST
tara:strand:- start:129 stop:611 length:483 start_codon:yes stop_codon:yes gene_type:complete